METDIETLKAAVKLCFTEEEAYKIVGNMSGVSKETATWFHNKYATNDTTTAKQAFSQFYKDVKANKV